MIAHYTAYSGFHVQTRNLGFVRQRCMSLDPTEENDSYDIILFLFPSEFKKEWP